MSIRSAVIGHASVGGDAGGISPTPRVVQQEQHCSVTLLTTNWRDDIIDWVLNSMVTNAVVVAWLVVLYLTKRSRLLFMRSRRYLKKKGEAADHAQSWKRNGQRSQ